MNLQGKPLLHFEGENCCSDARQTDSFQVLSIACPAIARRAYRR